MKTNQYKFVGNISINQQEKIVSRIEKDFPGGEYLITTYKGRHTQFIEFVNSTLFAFNPTLLADATGLPVQLFEALYKIGDDSVNDALSILISEKFRTKNLSFYEYILKYSQFTFADALASYDQEEHEIVIGKKTFFIYRIN